MRNKMLAGLAAAALLSGAMLSNPAKAMMSATPSALGVATTDTGLVQKAWYYRRHYGYYRHRYYGYYRPYYGLYGYYRPYGYYHRWWW